MYWGRARIFLILCGSFTAGVFVSRYMASFYLHFIAVSAVFFIILITLFWPADLRSFSEGGNKKWFMIAGFAGLFLLFGIWRYQAALPDTSNLDFIGNYYQQKVTLEGVVWEDPDIREHKTNLIIKPDEYQGKLLVNVGHYPEYQYGDRLTLTGKLEEPFESEEFSYKNYLSRFGIYGVMSFPRVEKAAEGEGRLYKSVLLAVKHKFKDVLSRVLPEPHNAFLLGLLLGLKRAIPEELSQAFIVTGVSHIVVVSGYNISIITRNLLKTRLVFGRRIAFALSILAVLAFVVLTGAEASVIRASVMGLLLVYAMNIGRVYEVINALLLTGAAMIFLTPQILHFDIGFQLSFLATLGLILLAPVFDKWLYRLPDFLGFRTNLSSTLAAQIFTLPLLIFYFDRLSLIAPLVNVLILWAIPYTMLFGFLVGLLGIVYLPLASYLSGIPWIFLEFMIYTVESFARIPFAARAVQINVAGIVFFYAVLLLTLFLYRYKKKFFYQLEYFDARV